MKKTIRNRFSGFTAYISEAENGNTMIEIDGVPGHAQFSRKREAKKFIAIQFEKSIA